jgi:WD40 repeat protein
MKKLLFILTTCFSLNGFGQIEVYDSLIIGKEINSFSISKDKKHLVTSVGNRKPELLVFDMISKEIIRKIKIHSKSISRIQFSPDGKYLATSSWDKTITILKSETYEVVHVFKGHKKLVTGFCFYADDRLATSSKDGSVITWDLINGKQLNLFDTKMNRMSHLSFDPINLRFSILASTHKSVASILYFLDENLTEINQKSFNFYGSVKYLDECKSLYIANHKSYLLQKIDSKGNILDESNQHKHWIYDYIGLSNCNYVATSSEDKSLKIYSNGKLVFNLEFKKLAFKMEKLSDNEFACMSINGEIKFIRIVN